MAIVLTNGEYYIVTLKNGKIGKTKDIDKAQKYSSCNSVNDFMSCHQTAHTNCHQIA